MGLTEDLLDLFTDTATWNKLASRGDYGNPVYTPIGPYPARYVRKNKAIRKSDTQQITSTSQVWLLPSLTSGDPFPLVQIFDQVVLSDGRTPQIVDVQIFEDELTGQTGNPSHCVVFFV